MNAKLFQRTLNRSANQNMCRQTWRIKTILRDKKGNKYPANRQNVPGHRNRVRLHQLSSPMIPDFSLFLQKEAGILTEVRNESGLPIQKLNLRNLTSWLVIKKAWKAHAQPVFHQTNTMVQGLSWEVRQFEEILCFYETWRFTAVLTKTSCNWTLILASWNQFTASQDTARLHDPFWHRPSPCDTSLFPPELLIQLVRWSGRTVRRLLTPVLLSPYHVTCTFLVQYKCSARKGTRLI
jgi:hypothetical protein